MKKSCVDESISTCKIVGEKFYLLGPKKFESTWSECKIVIYFMKLVIQSV